jgi:hypothetical protein
VSVTGGIRSTVLFAVVGLLPLLWLSLLIPVHIVVEHPATTEPHIARSGELLPAQRLPIPSYSAIVIEHVGPPGSVVELALPVADAGGRLTAEAVEITAGAWNLTHNGERIESTEPGSRASFQLLAAEPELPFVARPDGGTAYVVFNERTIAVELKAETYRWQPLPLEPQAYRTLTLAGRLVAFRNVAVTLIGEGAASVSLQLGSGRIITVADLAEPGRYEFSITGRQSLGLLLSLAATLYSAFAQAGLIILLSAAIGFTLRNGYRRAHTEPVGVLDVAVGFCAFALAANTLSYFWAAEVTAPILAATFALATGLGIVSCWARLKATTGTRQCMSTGGLMPALVSVWLCFWPVAIAGEAYLGLLQTDSFFYTNVASAIQERSLLAHIEDGSLIGYGMRSVDLALAATLASVAGISTLKVWLLLSIVAMALPPLSAHAFVLEWLRDRRIASVAAWGVALSAPLSSLFFEAYFAQFLLMAVLYMNLLGGLRLFNAVQAERVTWADAAPYVFTSTLAVLLYPYFALLPFIIAAALMYAAARRSQILWVSLYGGVAVALANVGLLFLLNPGATDQFTAALNALAYHIVFPFFNEPKFPAFLLGVTPFHGTAELFMRLSTELGESWLFILIAGFSRTTQASYLLPALFLSSFGLSLAIAWRELVKGFGGVLLATMAGYFALLLVAAAYSGLYAFAKLAWTLAGLGPVLIVPSMLLAARQGNPAYALGRWARPVLFVFLAVLLALNAFSKVVPTFLWIANGHGAAQERTNVAIAGDLLTLREEFGRLPDDLRLYIVVPTTYYQPKQSLLVLGAHVNSMMQTKNYVCYNCLKSPLLLDYRGFTPVLSAPGETDIVVSLGRARMPESGGSATSVVRGMYLQVLVPCPIHNFTHPLEFSEDRVGGRRCLRY